MGLSARELGSSLASLERRGWATGRDGAWLITEDGRQARLVAIENATNAKNAMPYESLTVRQRNRVSQSLRALPDQPPREKSANSQTS